VTHVTSVKQGRRPSCRDAAPSQRLARSYSERVAIRKDRTTQRLAEFAHVIVRAGYLNRAHALMEVGNAARAELDDDAGVDDLADQLVDDAEAELAREQASWPERTDNDALREVRTELADQGFLVLEYCADHFDPTAELKARPGAAGLVFFTESDAWRAVTDQTLQLSVRRADASVATSADPEVASVLESLRRHGLEASFTKGRVTVPMVWRRREML
jgi:hypothetical protein